MRQQGIEPCTVLLQQGNSLTLRESAAYDGSGKRDSCRKLRGAASQSLTCRLPRLPHSGSRCANDEAYTGEAAAQAERSTLNVYTGTLTGRERWPKRSAPLPSGHHKHEGHVVTVSQESVELVVGYPFCFIQQHLDYRVQLARLIK